MISPTQNVHASDTEKAYAEELGVNSVILLPSVRAGIHMVIRAANEPGTIVVGPAYTCHTVHEAMALSGARSRLVDSAPDSFLMSHDDIYAATEPGCALLLSEVYGIPYDLQTLRSPDNKRPGVRILDLAMCIPSPERMKELETRDVALFSFGWGKPMYSGWGGIACFQNLELAVRVREIRDQWTLPETFNLKLRHGWSVLIDAVANHRGLYGLTHEPHLYRVFRKTAATGHKGDCQLKSSGPLPPQWSRPMTTLNRKLALHNLRNFRGSADHRRSQAEVYSSSLVETGIVRGPGSKTLPQSHFPIRLPSSVRDKMCAYLRGRGIDTSTLFPFPGGLSRALYPYAAEAADEVLTLPMGLTITLEEVRMVSNCVKDGLKVLGC
jgi:dTDP-4-amino-4,6-dideoxygalactose transaminase